MSKRRQAQERRKDEAQTQGALLARAQRVAKAIGVAVPTALPSKYTRKGAKARRVVTALAQVSEEELAELQRRRAERERQAQERERQRLEALRRQGEAERERRLRTEPTAPGTMVVRFQPTAAPPRPRPRSPALRTMMAMTLLGMGAGLPPDPEER